MGAYTGRGRSLHIKSVDDPQVSEYRTYDASAAMSAAEFVEWSLGRMNNAVGHCLSEALPRLPVYYY